MTDSAPMTSTADPFAAFKTKQRELWANFAPLAALTTPTAAKLVRFARVAPGQRVLDVGCGTGVVAISAARLAGARVCGADLTPALLEVARENATIAGCGVDFREADVEQLPFGDAEFDVVLSQFGHIFAPRPEVAIAEMLRVLKPGGTIAFSSWPPELFNGRLGAIVARYLPPPAGLPSPMQWGDVHVIRERLGALVRDLTFERDTMIVPALSPQHHRAVTEHGGGTMRTLVMALEKTDPAKLAEARREYDALAAEYFTENTVRQGFLMTRATKP